MTRAFFIVGPTATGKSDLAAGVAREWDGEVVGAEDLEANISRLPYRMCPCYGSKGRWFLQLCCLQHNPPSGAGLTACVV
jgi:hypothetical protein